MSTVNKPEGKQVAIINGFFALIIAVISLIGGYFLKDPIDKVLFKPHCQIGGVWKPHGDVMTHCDVTKFEDDESFSIRISGTLASGSDFLVNGSGKMGKSSGEFKGKWIWISKIKEATSEELSGRVGLQGCDGLGVILTFDTGENLNYSFIREVSNMISTPEINDAKD